MKLLLRKNCLLLVLCLMIPACSQPRPISTAASPAAPVLLQRTPTAAITAAAAPTSQPALDVDAFKDMRFCKLVVGCVELEDGRFQQNDISGRLLEPRATGDVNGDGWPDAAILIEEKYGGTLNVDLVVLLNRAGRAKEAAAVSAAGADARVERLSIENGQIVIERTFPLPVQDSKQPDPHFTTVRAQSRYRLAGDRLVEEQLTTWAQDGTARGVEPVAPPAGAISSSTLEVALRLSEAPYQERLLYTVYDAAGAEVFNGEGPVTQTGAGEYRLPIDLSWAPPGALRIVIQDFYTTPNLGASLAFNTLAIDYQPGARAMPAPLFSAGSFKMIDADHGWARSADSGRLLRTDDSGETWWPSPLPFDGSFSLAVLDADTAWAYPDDPDLTRKALYRTSDGGHTWQPLPEMNAHTVGGTTGSLYFNNPQQGFFEEQPHGSFMMGQTRFALYRTMDGALTWEKVFDNTAGGGQAGEGPHGVGPHRGRLAFQNMLYVWAWDDQLGMVVPGSLFLMRSYDSGRTWQDEESRLPRIPLPLNTMISQLGMFFFGSDEIVMPVLILPSEGQKSVRLYLSTDVGKSWRLSSQAFIQSDGLPVIIPFSTQITLIWDGKTLQSTEDGGTTWAAQPFQAPSSGSIVELQFVSRDRIFALVNDHNPDADCTDLYRSTDGGQTWQRAAVEMLP